MKTPIIKNCLNCFRDLLSILYSLLCVAWRIGKPLLKFSLLVSLGFMADSIRADQRRHQKISKEISDSRNIQRNNRRYHHLR